MIAGVLVGVAIAVAAIALLLFLITITLAAHEAGELFGVEQ